MTTRAYARTKEQEAALMAHGVPAKDIYLEGRGAETLEACLATFRSRPGLLVLAHDLRAIGSTKRAVAAIMDRLELAGIKVQDIFNPQDATQAAMIQRANVAISGARFEGDRPRARRQGRQGGRSKGRAAWGAREALAPAWLVDNLVDHPKLTYEDVVGITDGKIPESTLRRHYGAAKRRERKKAGWV